MTTQTTARPSAAAVAVYEWLNPLPYGFFTAALIFDIIYACTANIQWVNGASWLIAIGTVFAIIPRLINFGSGVVRQQPAARFTGQAAFLAESDRHRSRHYQRFRA